MHQHRQDQDGVGSDRVSRVRHLGVEHRKQASHFVRRELLVARHQDGHIERAVPIHHDSEHRESHSIQVRGRAPASLRGQHRRYPKEPPIVPTARVDRHRGAVARAASVRARATSRIIQIHHLRRTGQTQQHRDRRGERSQ